MQMLEPDFWKGRGRYSKQALSRRILDEKPIHLPVNLLGEAAEK
jgi:hypothetical protein